eukprot:CAMPEP_0184306856 /NCGR_PEP_ID=MMETSP1049-20130417/15744_1 /TAXON_ID=77928 /ORGANISM="Proteomonas sulcata, Strain CCMP704" /LENGTH=151 /DNA_ID=CAMNT_0026619209 /DNA_START=213 /DNA_END=668 /DNA_ORIENTATION=-
MAPPLWARVTVTIIECVFIVVGGRDIVAPGYPLPLPDDDKLMTLWFDDVKTDIGHGFLCQLIGCFICTVGLSKIIMCWMPAEGQILRYYLTLNFMFTNMFSMGVAAKAAPHILQKYGGNIYPFVGIWGIETLAFAFFAFSGDKSLKAKKVK